MRKIYISLALPLALFTVLFLFSAPSAHAAVEGECGENLTYSWSTQGGSTVLTISGEGPMYDFSSGRIGDEVSRYSPWTNTISEVIISPGVTSIGRGAFHDCYHLQRVTIPDSVETIGDYAFERCESLGSITIPDSVTRIGEYAFLRCPFQSLTIPSSVTEVGEYAFGYCSNLTDLKIESGLTAIPTQMFYACSSLKQVSLPESVTSIGNSAFGGSGLESIRLPDKLTEIGDNAFGGCKDLAEVRIPDSVRSLGFNVFSGCSGLQKAELGKGLTKIESSTFQDCTALESITLPDSITEVGYEAFKNCTGLKTLNLSKNLAVIGRAAFQYCSALRELVIPNGIGSITTEAFYGCSALESLRLPPNLRSIYTNAFGFCSSLKTVTLPENVSLIDEFAFQNCRNMKRIYLPASVEKIGIRAFYGCDGLRHVYYGGTEQQWNDIEIYTLPDDRLPLLEAALHCESTGFPPEGSTPYDGADGEGISWTVSDGTLTISGTGPMADYAEIDAKDNGWRLVSPPWWSWNAEGSWDENRRQIRKVVVEEGVTTVGSGAFRDLEELESVELPESVTRIGGFAFHSDAKLTGLSLPDGLAEIWDAAFCDSGLAVIDIPDKVTSIGDEVFLSTALTEITIPAGVTQIGDCVFHHCLALSDIHVSPDNNVYKSQDGILFSKDGTELISYCPGRTEPSYQIPDGVQTVHPYAFSVSGALEELRFPDSLTEIGDHALAKTGIKYAELPPNLTFVSEGAFIGCEDLASITVPLSLAAVEGYAFEGCTALKDVYYEGTREQWDAILKESGNEPLLNAELHESCPYSPMVLQSRDGLGFTLSLRLKEEAAIWCAWYDQDGHFLDCFQTAAGPDDTVFSCPASRAPAGAKSCGAFLMNGDFRPLCPNLMLTDEPGEP